MFAPNGVVDFARSPALSRQFTKSYAQDARRFGRMHCFAATAGRAGGVYFPSAVQSLSLVHSLLRTSPAGATFVFDTGCESESIQLLAKSQPHDARIPRRCECRFVRTDHRKRYCDSINQTSSIRLAKSSNFKRYSTFRGGCFTNCADRTLF